MIHQQIDCLNLTHVGITLCTSKQKCAQVNNHTYRCTLRFDLYKSIHYVILLAVSTNHVWNVGENHSSVNIQRSRRYFFIVFRSLFSCTLSSCRKFCLNKHSLRDQRRGKTMKLYGCLLLFGLVLCTGASSRRGMFRKTSGYRHALVYFSFLRFTTKFCWFRQKWWFRRTTSRISSSW